MITLYGIKNCDTVRKARLWLNEHQLDHHFHDYKTDGLSTEQLAYFSAQLGWSSLINRSSTSWRQLEPQQQSILQNLIASASSEIEPAAAQILQKSPTLLKRPILDADGVLLVGFKADVYRLQCLQTGNS